MKIAWPVTLRWLSLKRQQTHVNQSHRQSSKLPQPGMATRQNIRVIRSGYRLQLLLLYQHQWLLWPRNQRQNSWQNQLEVHEAFLGDPRRIGISVTSFRKRDSCQDKRDEMAKKLKGPRAELRAGYEAGDETLTQSTFLML